MRKNVSGLLSQFGFGVANDLLAAVIVLAAVAVVITLALLGVL